MSIVQVVPAGSRRIGESRLCRRSHMMLVMADVERAAFCLPKYGTQPRQSI